MVFKPQKTNFQLKIVENIQTLSIWAKNPWRRYSLSLNSRAIPILHPGPINRGIEISSQVVDEYPNCLINNQVANGIPIRMALLYLLQKYNK